MSSRSANKSRLSRHLARFYANADGGIAITMALSGLVISMLMLFTLDYSRARALEARLQAAADSAVLNAIQLDDTKYDVAGRAEDYFYAQLDERDHKQVEHFTGRLEVRDRLRHLDVTFRANLANSFLPALGMGNMMIGGEAAATLGAPAQMRLHFIMDVSDSMGIAATEQARKALIDATKAKGWGACEFACHRNANLQLARDIKVPLRVDHARDGVTRMIDVAVRDYPDNRYQFSLTAISSNAVTVTGLTSDKSEFMNALNMLEVGYGIPKTEDANTWFNLTLPKTAAWLDSQQAPEVRTNDVVVLVTDGVNSQNNSHDPGIVKPLDLAYCEQLKRNGRKLAVIYTEYLPIPTDGTYNDTVRKFQSQIEPNLRKCASGDLFLVANDADDFGVVFEEMFHLVNRVLYLSK